jgi:hypothetical protein
MSTDASYITHTHPVCGIALINFLCFILIAHRVEKHKLKHAKRGSKVLIVKNTLLILIEQIARCWLHFMHSEKCNCRKNKNY